MATDVKVAVTGSGSVAGATVDDIRNITVTREKAEKQYASSSTSGKIKRALGHEDISGTFTAYVPSSNAGPTSLFAFEQGDEGVALVLNSWTSQKLYDSATDGTVTITNIEFEANVEGGDIIAATVTWGRT